MHKYKQIVVVLHKLKLDFIFQNKTIDLEQAV